LRELAIAKTRRSIGDAAVDNNEQMWSLYAEALIALFNFSDPTKGSSNALCLFNRPFVADWWDPLDGDRFGEYRLFTFANQLPKYQTVFDTQGAITQGYEQFLSSVAIPTMSAGEIKEYNDLLGEQTKARGDNTQAESDASAAYDQYVKEQLANGHIPDSYDTWLSDTGWDQTLVSYQNVLDNITASMDQLLVRAYQGKLWARDLQKNYDGAQYRDRVHAWPPANPNQPPEQDKLETIPRFLEVGQSLKDFVRESLAGTGTAGSLHFAHDTGTYDFSHSDWSGDTSFFSGWFSFGGGGGGSSDQVDTSDRKFEATLSWKNASTIFIEPDLWFNQDAMRYFDQNPNEYQPGSPGANGALYGPRGGLGAIIKQLFVVFQPSITVSMDATQYSRVQSSWSAHASFGFGPFGVGADYNENQCHISWDNQNSAFTITDTTNNPKILAIVCDTLP